MKNAEWMVVNGYPFEELQVVNLRNGFYGISLAENSRYFWKINCSSNEWEEVEALRLWLDQEHKDTILTIGEFNYLKALIEPFREDVSYLEKTNHMDYLFIYKRISNGKETVLSLIPLRENFKGMEENKEYTPEELGL